MRAIDPARFPNVVRALREAGHDPSTRPVPVAPASHYVMGGIVTDLEGRSTVAGLYAVGECACTGLHGANRLASNSLSECFVFGYRAAFAALGEPAPGPDRLEPTDAVAGPPSRETRRAMWEHAGLEREAATLAPLLTIRIPSPGSSPAARSPAKRPAARTPAPISPRRTPIWTGATRCSPPARSSRVSSSGRDRSRLNAILINTAFWKERDWSKRLGRAGVARSSWHHPGGSSMYHFSRSIYRELADAIVEDRPDRCGPTNHERVLRSCESAIHRLATDRHYFARPSKSLFNDIRVYFPMNSQLRVYRVVDCYLQLAREWFEEREMAGYDIEGNRLECRATTRRGTPCQRTPLPRNGYCPSHQHLAETEGVPLAA